MNMYNTYVLIQVISLIRQQLVVTQGYTIL
jgi:hypothetical protein